MSVEVVPDSPLGQALNAVVQPKLVELGWSQGGGDEAALAEYIILMLANGKTQEAVAAEISGDLLGLGSDDPGPRDFSIWLFQQVAALQSQQNGSNLGVAAPAGDAQADMANGAHDSDMEGVSETGDSNVYAISSVDLSGPDLRLPPRPPPLTYRRPTGPKSMRNGATSGRDKRMLGHLAKAMDRRPNDSVLHRVRPQNGNERINTHSRGPPTGPRQQQMPGRGGPRQLNNRMNNAMAGMPMQQGGAANNIMNMTPQQQLELYAMLEQQSRLMAQMLNPQGMPMGNGLANGFQQPPQQPPRSLFDRVPRNARPQNNGFQKGSHANKFERKPKTEGGEPSSMDVEMSQSQEKKEINPETTACKFNLSCTVADCKFAHQSPAAPVGTPIDFNDTCSFGAACQNKKCVGKHPSPASHLQQICKFYPNCTKGPACPFRHPAKQCRNGGDCAVPGCTFAHTTTMCRFNPCTRPDCPFKHAEGQRGVFKDKVWTPNNAAKEHVSERKFVDENGPEELIVPEKMEGAPLSQESIKTEIIT
ncbi:related to nuclear poly(A)-binding protein [Phialocephala subalpina]|uniref:Related to nuclear poly(A)-binding protein n=1 Tax=Phialocephala subalpina TaxID=576137 RepID=A0A1L7WCD4_9HELO|nr:related to nuclear poly(A)-binding protein [Phialocephala subalpina]